jgi:hypothetical protein
MENHRHNGADIERIDPKDLKARYFPTVGSVPTARPTNFVNQIQLYVSGGTALLYVWDEDNQVWRKFNYYIAP